jgi:hypothetical protein
MTDKVTLPNGLEIDWNIFVKWSDHRQKMFLDHPTRDIKWDNNHCTKMRKIVKQSYENGTRKINWNYGEKNGQARAVITPAGRFPSIRSACSQYGINASKLRHWMKVKPNDFYFEQFLSNAEINLLRPGMKAVKTPEGNFPSIAAAARHYKVGERTIKTWIRGMRSTEFSYIDN